MCCLISKYWDFSDLSIIDFQFNSSVLIEHCLYVLSLPKFVLWSRIWSILMNILCAFEKNVYLSIFGWNILCMSLRLSWLVVLFRSSTSLLNFGLFFLLITERGMLNSLTIILGLSAFSSYIKFDLYLSFCIGLFQLVQSFVFFIYPLSMISLVLFTSLNYCLKNMK